MHFVAGLFLTTVFLCAHIVDQTDFPLPENDGVINKNWYVHQMETTANFSNKKSLFSWFIGGLNYQIDHHLFPSICHVHYYELSKIVKSTAEEFNLPYHANKSFLTAEITYSLGDKFSKIKANEIMKKVTDFSWSRLKLF